MGKLRIMRAVRELARAHSLRLLSNHVVNIATTTTTTKMATIKWRRSGIVRSTNFTLNIQKPGKKIGHDSRWTFPLGWWEIALNHFNHEFLWPSEETTRRRRRRKKTSPIYIAQHLVVCILSAVFCSICIQCEESKN